MHLIIRVISIMLLGSILIKARPQDDKMPSNCSGQNYCTHKSESYPQTVFNRLLGSIDARDSVLQTDNQNKSDTDMEQRIGSTIKDGCRSKLKDQKVYEIIDQNEDLRYVAQMDERFTQEIRINVCDTPGRVNSTVQLGSIQEDVNVSCVELTLDFKFLVLKKDKSGLELAQAKGGIPVACMCKVIKSSYCYNGQYGDIPIPA